MTTVNTKSNNNLGLIKSYNEISNEKGEYAPIEKKREENGLNKLPDYKRKNTFDYYLVKRTDHTAIYHQKDNGKHIAYEVSKIIIQRRRELNGRVFPRKEKFPANEDFGKAAWTYYHYESALRKFEELEAERKP